MKRNFLTTFLTLFIGITFLKSQIVLLQDHQCNNSAYIGSFNNIRFYEGGFSGLYLIPGTNGKEFWTCTDRGVNVDCANANPTECRPGYDKLYCFPDYTPKIHRLKISGDSIQIVNSIALKNPFGKSATGLLNPTNFGSTATEIGIRDTVRDCNNFTSKLVSKDTFGIDAEGICIDPKGNFWLCEEGGPTIWQLNSNGKLLKRYTPYAFQPGSINGVDVQIDTVFKYRKNNRGLEGITISPSGKIYSIIQSPLLYPTKAIGEATRIHRILELDPVTNQTKMFAYLNDGVTGPSGSNQIRLRDWKIGDMTAINDSLFLVIEQARRGTSDYRKIYLINIKNATPVNSGLYNNSTLEALVDSNGLSSNGINPVKKTLFLDLNANGWPFEYEKAEGISILNDSTIAIAIDNDYGQVSPNDDGIPIETGYKSHLLIYRLQGTNKIVGLKPVRPDFLGGITGPQSSHSPYLLPKSSKLNITSILTAGNKINDYSLAGIPDGMGAYDNNNETFTLIANHEIPSTNGEVRLHGQKGAFISKWTINKKDLSVIKGEDAIKEVYYWDGSGYLLSNMTNPAPQGAIGRLCSGDLAEESAYSFNDLGIKEKLFLSGEEIGNEGRVFAHILTGVDAGKSYELPYLGKFSWENAVANPFKSSKTFVIGLDDSSPGQVYLYIGNKSKNGLLIDKAGLTNGKLYGIKIDGLPNEPNDTVPDLQVNFSLAELGDVHKMSGVEINTKSNTLGVTNFLRPEDGCWDPSNPADFYFVTTNSFNTPSRLWRLRFSDLNAPEKGGIASILLSGREGQKMLDNITMDHYGNIILQEDPGNQEYLCKVWQFNVRTGKLSLLAEADENRFTTGALNYLTRDEESSGIIDVQKILGPGHYLLNLQAHYSIPGQIYEGGQLMHLFNPTTANASNGSSANNSQENYLIPVDGKTKINSLISAGDQANNLYKMVGIPDGMGAFDNHNGTFTLLVNHEIPAGNGAIRAHGHKGAFISKWIINKKDLTVLQGKDLIRKINLWNSNINSYTLYDSANSTSSAALSRFCAADLPAETALYNYKTGLGTQERIFFNGEEIGANGRAFAHFVTEENDGESFELPRLGKFSWESAIACPTSSDKTFIIGLDDSSPGQIYCYQGTKTNSGYEVDKAGLTNGVLYGLSVTGLNAETSSSIPPAETPFTLIEFGDVTNISGDSLNAISNRSGVTNFLRPEDGAWDPIHPKDFYFVTTNSFNSPSRLWRCRFSDVSRWELGGTISAVLDGSEGQKMLDNITIDQSGHIFLQEDPGSNIYLAKVWMYDIATDKLIPIAQFNPNLFIPSSENFLTQDEESSGIIDVQDILGPGKFMLNAQTHYSIPGEIYEGGQLLAFTNEVVAQSNSTFNIKGNGLEIVNNDLTPNFLDSTNFGNVKINQIMKKTFELINTSSNDLIITEIMLSGNTNNSFFLDPITLPLVIKANSNLLLNVNILSSIIGIRTAQVVLITSDINNKIFKFAIEAKVGSGTLVQDNNNPIYVNIFPSPASQFINIELKSKLPDPIQIKLIDATGKVIQTQEKKYVTQNEIQSFTLSTTHIPSGMYNLVVIQSGAKLSFRTAILH
ncbi:MAG: T9SS type A sorting domain-containing protein [Saprospiraceae bacterium]|nr:T9SS type A sorting domain-containing protein [Saprospiraceae bacterium]